jgi:hypothetical protein
MFGAYYVCMVIPGHMIVPFKSLKSNYFQENVYM